MSGRRIRPGDVYKRQALDYLLAEGRDVDALFITHLHLDHIGGVADLLDAGVPIGQVYLPLNAARQQADPDALRLLDRLAAAGVPITELARGDEMRYNTTSISVLWPVREHIRSGQDPNELPLVLSIGFGPYLSLIHISCRSTCARAAGKISSSPPRPTSCSRSGSWPRGPKRS